jgi:hypothetical protein
MGPLVVSALVTGCGAAPPSTMNMPPGDTGQQSKGIVNWQVPPAPSNGVQIVLDPVKNLPAASDSEYCTWTDKILDQDMDIKTAVGFQSKTGHHVVIYTTGKMQPPGTTRLCTNDDMATFRFGVGTGGDGNTKLGSAAPGDLVFRLPKGSQIVVNAHYLNATPDIYDGRSGVNLLFADPGAKSIPSSPLAIVKTDLSIGAGATVTDINCTFQNDLKAWLFLPHMHAWGQHIDIVHTPMNGTPTTLSSTDWIPTYTFEPPLVQKDPSTPYVFHKGDTIAVHCHYENDTGKTIRFGQEMCVGFGEIIDDTGVGGLYCDNGDWGPL